MDSQDPKERQIIRSWQRNAAPWSDAVRSGSIASRKLVTNQAIVAAVLSVSPRCLLDLGCGEGWLARALAAPGTHVTGIDVIPELIERARESSAAGSAVFEVQDYGSVADRRWQGGRFDAAVCNFSLLGSRSVDALIAALPYYLKDGGHLIIQTLHPVAAGGAQPYVDGWRPGSWLGFGGEFSDPAPWYFRTIGSWTALIERCGFEIVGCQEPTAPGAVTPASIIWTGKLQPHGANSKLWSDQE